MNRILRILFLAYNKKKNQFAKCCIFIQEIKFNISNVYQICVDKNYLICSEIKIDILIRDRCKEQGGECWKSYCNAENKGFSFNDFPDGGMSSSFRCPRIGENDFEYIVKSLGGKKIIETQKRTPDFELNNILLELKDLQEESLEKKQRQESISEIFKNKDSYAINIDPSLDFGELTNSYHLLIKNTIENKFKSASKQIKQYKKQNNNFESAGIILLNTGLHSLPHELFKKMVTDILNNKTKTIEFAFIFSQIMQTNGMNMYVLCPNEWIGNKPPELDGIKIELDKLIHQRMTDMVCKNDTYTIIESVKPISFERNNKVFYWNPGQLSFPWEEK